MPIGLRDLAAFQVPAVDPMAGGEALGRLGTSLMDLARMKSQGEISAAQIAAQRQASADATARNAADIAAQQRRQQAQQREARRTAAQKAYGEFVQALKTPGGAARAATQIPALQATGVKWQPLPDGSYGFSFGDGEQPDENWGNVPLAQLTADDRAATEKALGAAIKASSARNAGEVAGAGAMAVHADPSLAGKEALQTYEGVVNPQLNRLQSDLNSRRSAAAQAEAARNRQIGPGVDPKVMNYAAQRQQQIYRAWEMNSSTRQLKADIASSNKAVAAMSSDNPLDQGTAFFQRLHANQGGRPTDRDLQYELAQGGLLTRLQTGLQRAMNGQFSEEYRKDFTEAAERMREYDLRRLAKQARGLGDLLMNDPAITAYVGPDMAQDFAHKAEEQVLGAANATGDEAPSAPGGYDPNDPNTWPDADE